MRPICAGGQGVTRAGGEGAVKEGRGAEGSGRWKRGRG